MVARRNDALLTAPVPVRGTRFTIATSGVAEGPSQALARYLLEQDAAEVTVVTHPLVAEAAGEHQVEQLVAGTKRILVRPNRPPLTFALDPFSPARLPPSDVWFGFNCLATAQGLARRKARRTRMVLHWSVDFVPNRFGQGTVLTRAYNRLDRHCILNADGRVELSQAALEGRLEAYGLAPDQAPAQVVPMGAWLGDTPTTNPDNIENPRLVFVGHLVERMGARLLVDLAQELARRGRPVPLDIIGGGPQLDELQSAAQSTGSDQHITFHGFVPEFSDVQLMLSQGAIALAPYQEDPGSFSRFADPGKLKAYLAAGLPTLLTAVPPNARELQEQGGAVIVSAGVVAFADAICDLLDSPTAWHERRERALRYAGRFDWSNLFAQAFPRLGLLAR